MQNEKFGKFTEIIFNMLVNFLKFSFYFIFFDEFYVAGYRYYDGLLIEDSLLPGKEVRFQRKPDCLEDTGAVEIYTGRKKLGYIPRKDNAYISKLLDQGVTVKGEICKRNFDDRIRKRIKITAYKEYTS